MKKLLALLLCLLLLCPCAMADGYVYDATQTLTVAAYQEGWQRAWGDDDTPLTWEPLPDMENMLYCPDFMVGTIQYSGDDVSMLITIEEAVLTPGKGYDLTEVVNNTTAMLMPLFIHMDPDPEVVWSTIRNEAGDFICGPMTTPAGDTHPYSAGTVCGVGVLLELVSVEDNVGTFIVFILPNGLQ